MKLTDVPCSECRFFKWEIDLGGMLDQNGYLKTEATCPNCNHPVEVIVHIYDPSEVPF